MQILLFLLLNLWAGSFSPATHDFHAALATVKQNALENTLEVTIRLFTDDLELAVSNASKKKFRLNQSDSVEPELAEYLAGNFAIYVQGRLLPSQFVGKEFDNDVCYIYYQATYSQLKGDLLLEFSTLTEVFEDQNNLMNITLGTKKETLLFDRGRKKHTLKI